MSLSWLVYIADQPLRAVPCRRLPAGDKAVNLKFKLKSVQAATLPPVGRGSFSTSPTHGQVPMAASSQPLPHRTSGASKSLWKGCHFFDIFFIKTLLGAQPTCSLFPLAYMRRL